MDLLAYYEQLIPGYSQLDEDIRVRFEDKEAGKKLKTLIALHHQRSWFAPFFPAADIEEATQIQFIDEITNN